MGNKTNRIKIALQSLRLFALFLSGHFAQAQNILGAWVIEDVHVSYTRPMDSSEKTFFSEYRTKYLSEYKGKIIHDYRKDSIQVLYSVNGNDTTEFDRRIWWD